jgi:oxygen-independent coproporphyrinogen III oxidase
MSTPTVDARALADLLNGTPYAAYTYAYPHKSAYRPLDTPRPLRQVWAGEPQTALFLYWHIPFCEMRCGFCNLFTTTNAEEDMIDAYLRTLERHARQTRAALADNAHVARMAIGGGTPTFLSVEQLARLFDLSAELFGVRGSIPISVETSPHTATPERIAVLQAYGVERVSIGVQSFVLAEAHTAGRPQRAEEVTAALTHLHAAKFPILNIDLIYGIEGQTVESWLWSLREALQYQPQELYLYPLYVRPLTGLGKHPRAWDDLRWSLYHAGRDYLLARGYRQISMRLFRAADAPRPDDAPVYCCQEDGMIGVGCGARSYTRALHYSSDYAVSARGVRAILQDYIGKDDAWLGAVHYGFALDADEQRRRYLLKSLFHSSGLNVAAYQAYCDRHSGRHSADDEALFAALIAHAIITDDGDGAGRTLRPTARGLALADAAGPWLYSPSVRALMNSFEVR